MSNITVSTTADRETQLIVLFNLLIQTFAQVLDGFIWIFGNIGAVCTCIVFSQAAFRKSACAMYFIASNFSQLFVFNFVVFIRMIQYGYGVPVNSVSAWFCKIRYYIYYASAANVRYNIIFAAVDRFLCSSGNARLRRWSSPKIALRLIILDAIVWLIFYSQVLVSFGITNDKCRVVLANLAQYFPLFLTIENGFFPILPLLLFGLLTIRNIRQSAGRVQAAAATTAGGSESGTNNRVAKKETQLHKMLANQVILYIIVNVPSPVYAVYRTYANVNSFRGSRALIDTFMNNFFYDMIYLGYALTFVNFLLTSEIFRREVKQIIQKNILHPCRRRIAPATSISLRVI